MKKVKAKKINVNELSTLPNNILNGGIYNSPICFLREYPVAGKTLRLKSCLAHAFDDEPFSEMSRVI